MISYLNISFFVSDMLGSRLSIIVSPKYVNFIRGKVHVARPRYLNKEVPRSNGYALLVRMLINISVFMLFYIG